MLALFSIQLGSLGCPHDLTPEIFPIFKAFLHIGHLCCSQCLSPEKTNYISDPLCTLLPWAGCTTPFNLDLKPRTSFPTNSNPVDWWPHSCNLHSHRAYSSPTKQAALYTSLTPQSAVSYTEAILELATTTKDHSSRIFTEDHPSSFLLQLLDPLCQELHQAPT